MTVTLVFASATAEAVALIGVLEELTSFTFAGVADSGGFFDQLDFLLNYGLAHLNFLNDFLLNDGLAHLNFLNRWSGDSDSLTTISMLSVTLILALVAAETALVLVLYKVASLASAFAKFNDFFLFVVEVDGGSALRLGLGGSGVHRSLLLVFLLLEFNSFAATSVSDFRAVSAASTAEAMALLRMSSVLTSFSGALLRLVGLKEFLELAHLETFLNGEGSYFIKGNVLGL